MKIFENHLNIFERRIEVDGTCHQIQGSPEAMRVRERKNDSPNYEEGNEEEAGGILRSDSTITIESQTDCQICS